MQGQRAQISREGTGQLELSPYLAPSQELKRISLSFPSRLGRAGDRAVCGVKPSKTTSYMAGGGQEAGRRIWGSLCKNSRKSSQGKPLLSKVSFGSGTTAVGGAKILGRSKGTRSRIHTLRPSQRWPRGGWDWAWEGHLEGAPLTGRAPAVWRESGTHPPGQAPRSRPRLSKQGVWGLGVWARGPTSSQLLRAELSQEVTRSRHPGDFVRRLWQS